MATTKPKAQADYDEKSLGALTSRDAVRLKPGMYIGPTDGAGIFTILRECLDNIIDEALAGNCTRGVVYFEDDGSYYVYDNGRGIPTGPMEVEDSISGTKYKFPALQVITSVLHAGGKLANDATSAYQVSRGSHGIGIKATNFLSSTFDVHTFYKGAWWSVCYKKGKLTQEVTKLKGETLDNPFGNTPLTKGTLIHFKPDLSIFSEAKFSASLLTEWATIASYFTPNFALGMIHHKGHTKTFKCDGGPAQYVKDHVAKYKCTPISEDIFTFQNELIDCVFQFTDYDGCALAGFTNGLSNPEKGVHFNAVFEALRTVIQPYAKAKQVFTLAELKEGVVGVINIKMQAPKFASQTKEKLVDDRAGAPVQEMLVEALTAFFKKHKALAELVCSRCTELVQLKSKFKASKAILGKLRAASKGGLPAKASLAPNCKAEQRELYLVEGESAGGCFAGQTRLTLADGSTKSIQDLYLEGVEWDGLAYNRSVPLPVEFEPYHPFKAARFSAPVITKYTTDLVVVKLEDTSDIVCTPDHPFLVEFFDTDKGWARKFIQAKDLMDTGWVIRDGEFGTLHVVHSVSKYTPPFPVPVYDVTNLDAEFSNNDMDKTFLAEGCVVHNTARYARDAHYQELLPLKGKILNAMRADDEKVLLSQEVVYILSMIGFDAKSEDPMRTLRVGKIISLVDPDPDGAHINSLILALLWKYMPNLYRQGLVYVTDSPEYYAKYKDDYVFGSSVQDMLRKLEKLGAPKSVEIHHIKGWGEIDATLMRRVAFDPSTRTLSRLSADSKEDTDRFLALMSNNPEARKILLGV